MSALHLMHNDLPTTNIPYAKENFWMSKYQQVTGWDRQAVGHTPVTGRTARRATGRA